MSQSHLPGTQDAFVRLAAIVTAMLGLVVLAGWVFAIPLLKSLLPGAVEMKANTAVGLVLAGSALFILRDRPSLPLRHVAQALALMVAALGLATFGEYVFGWQLGIDELLFRDATDAYNPIRGRMSPYSAVAFANIGFALAALPRPVLRPLVSLGAVVVTAIGAVSFLGYLWNARELVTDRWLPPVAVNTALAFILLGAGTLHVRRTPKHEPAAEGSRVRTAVETRVLFGFIGALALLFTAGGYTYWTGAEFADSAQRVTHTQEVRAALGKLYAAISDAEAAQRNYLLTGNQKHKNEYTRQTAEINGRETELGELIDDNTPQIHNFAELRALIAQRLDALAQQISIFEHQGIAKVRVAIAGDNGIPAMQAIRNLVERMDNAEKELMSKREAHLAHTRELTLIALLATLALATGILVFLFRDIRRQIAVRAQAEDEARHANAAKDTFLATMSHEIRTPLNGMLGMLELLSMSQLDDEQRECLEAARDSGGGLVRIIDDVLDHAKIEAGKLEIRPEPVSINQILRRVLNTYYAVASTKDLPLKDVVDPRISPVLLADSLRVSQILGNFLSNAIKFTAKGYVEVSVHLIGRAGGTDTVRFSVKDTGIGITPEAQERLFHPFEQAGMDTSRIYGGTGLGLAICRRLAEMMGGSISMESTPGQGTVMSLTLTLPISESTPSERRGQAANLVASNPSSGPGTPTTRSDSPLVLAVDDHPINRQLLARQLAILGLRAQTAGGGEEAFARWQGGGFALVITDCNMPEMDGYALTRAIREIETKEDRPWRTPIVAWTANVQPGAAAQCRAAGMDDMLTKPAALAQLKEVLSKWVMAHASSAADPVDAEQGGLGAVHPTPIDFGELQKIATNAAERADILLDFLTQTRADVAALEAALRAQDLLATGRLSHRIKGASRMVGARELATACEVMENVAKQGKPEAARVAKLALDRAMERLESHRCEAAEAAVENK